MAGHKFRIGQKVTLASRALNKAVAGGDYVTTRQLPEQGGELEYRIKRASEPHERVARESELARE